MIDQPLLSQMEEPDVASSSEDYAGRFAGEVGAWFLARQAELVVGALMHLPPGSQVLDVGGGHAQVAPALLRQGFDVTVLGSSPSCSLRLGPFLGEHCRFQLGSLMLLPFEPQSFDAVVSVRMMAHVHPWQQHLAELCRVARQTVVVDYPTRRSLNALAGRLFGFKRRVERNTRPFRLFGAHELEAVLVVLGFTVLSEQPQFIWPMVMHRVLGSRRLADALEAPARMLGLTTRFGSPIILRADRASN